MIARSGVRVRVEARGRGRVRVRVRVREGASQAPRLVFDSVRGVTVNSVFHSLCLGG